jgi:hypothetical protein
MKKYEYDVKLTIKFPHKPNREAIRTALDSVACTFTDALCGVSEAEEYQYTPNAKLKLEARKS